jgi:simple sugar transport system ATP-binding protein
MDTDVLLPPGPQPDLQAAPSGRGELLVEMVGISKSFGGLQALRDVNLTVRRNEVLGLVGDNAAGKSTLMKILTGAYHTDHGSIRFDGSPVHIQRPQDSRRLGIEMIYQDLGMCAKRSVVANLFLGRERSRMSLGFITILDWPGMRQDAQRILSSLHIDIESLDRPVEKLSGGQRQAVAIGRAVSFDPRVVIMDEPTASLALKEVEAVLELVRKLRTNGISVIFISHRLQDVFSVADRIAVLRSGELIGTYPAAEVTPDEIVRLMFLGRANRKVPSQSQDEEAA